MNGHLCQNYLAKAESSQIASVDNCFIVPKDGTPIAGLIQDHIIAAVYLSHKGSLFDKQDFLKYVYNAFLGQMGELQLPMPALIVNRTPYWTGKQVFSAIITNIASRYASANNSLPNLVYKTKLSPKVILMQIKEYFLNRASLRWSNWLILKLASFVFFLVKTLIRTYLFQF